MTLPARVKRVLGQSFGPFVVEVEKGQVRRLATAVGEEGAVHHDLAVAKAAGFKGLPATPGFAAALLDLTPVFDALEMHPEALMHSEEEYAYHKTICSGDVLSVTHTLSDAYQRSAPKGSKLTFLVVTSKVQLGEIKTKTAAKKAPVVLESKRTLVALK